ncbi:MAG: nucleotidyltransferase family protein [Acidobacteriaceae bacterium]
MPMPAVVLAAGASTRLGQPKQLVTIEEETLVDRAVRLAVAAGASPVFVVLGANADAIRSKAKLAGAVVVENAAWAEGMASSIRCGVDAVHTSVPQASGVLLMACDQPAVTAEHLQGLIAASIRDKKIAASQYGGRLGIPAAFPASEFVNLLQLTGESGARDVLRKNPASITALAFAAGELDVDTPEDLMMLRKPGQ